MPEARPTGQKPEIPLDVQSEIRRQIDDIVEHYGGRRPHHAPRRGPAPGPAPAERERGEQRSG